MGILDQVLLWPTTGSCRITVYPITTASGSPELSGKAPHGATTVDVTIDGNTYSAPVTNGIWILAAGTITPDLTDGQYDVYLEGLCDGVLVSSNTVNAVTVDTKYWVWMNIDDHIWMDDGGDLISDFI